MFEGYYSVINRKEIGIMDNIILRVKNLTKTYGKKTALRDVSFSVEKGRIYGFIGENGAGKTNCIRP